jgi:hypothetical protein
MTCPNLMGHKLEVIKWYFIISIWWLWILKNKIDMFGVFNFYNENWNLCWIEYLSLRTKILIKKFWRKENPTCLIFELGIVDYNWILDPNRIELTSRVNECVFIGYAVNSGAYRFYDLNAKVIIE